MGHLANLKDEFNYYLEHKDSFIDKYEGKFIAIKHHKAICEANTREDAIDNAIKIGNEIGTFLVQYISHDGDESVQRFYSRIYC